MSDDSPAGPAGQDPSLLSLRRELEREYEDKRRESKLQEKRMRGRLDKDRADWEVHRREQAQVLADKTEALRRQLESATQRAAQKEREQVALSSARKELDADRDARGAQMDALREKATRLEQAARAAQTTRVRYGFWVALAGGAIVGLTEASGERALFWLRVLAVALCASGIVLAATGFWSQRLGKTGE